MITGVSARLISDVRYAALIEYVWMRCHFVVQKCVFPVSSIYLDLTPGDVLWLYRMSPLTECRGGAGASVQCVPCPSRQDPCLLNGGVSQLPLVPTEGVNSISWQFSQNFESALSAPSPCLWAPSPCWSLKPPIKEDLCISHLYVRLLDCAGINRMDTESRTC